MDAETSGWWVLLCWVSAFNALAWAGSAWLLRRRQVAAGATLRRFQRVQLLLSFGYMAGCAYRSVLPVFDVPRLVLVDSWLSSVLVGRSVATVAELCFAAQWALLLRAAATSSGCAPALAASRLLVPLIALAETFSWFAVLTTANIGHVVEESIWGGCAALFVASLWWMRPRLDASQRRLATLLGAGGLAYAAYMFGIDVPMYWSRWLADEASGRHYLDVAQGLADVSARWVVSHRWADWRGEVVWMTLYFSVAVWVSIGLAHAPAVAARRAGAH